MKFVCAVGVSAACAAGMVGSVYAGADVQISTDQSVQYDGVDVGGFEEVASYREIAVHEDSGSMRDSSSAKRRARGVQVPIWSRVIRAQDADWVRVRFGQVQLAQSTEQVRESYLRITSLEDGYEQYLDAQSLIEWGNTTAYFNGDAVLVELMVSPNVTDQINRVRVVGVQASNPVTDRSICFGVDDRVLSSDPRDARLMPMGCSAWSFGTQGSCFLTAGHCGVSGSSVVQFNVPLSSNGGGTRNPPPQDQYVVDGSSVQSTSSIFIGNDWSYFGTFDNSTTGMTPLQAQGASHVLASARPPADSRPIRITGYGTTSSPVPASWNQVQKTHVGPLTLSSGNTVQYQTDTTGGNSGSSIVDDTNDTSIGIHTNGGCGTGGGANSGTSIFNSGLQNALANPLGICQPRTIQASLLFEPTHVSPAGGDVMTLVIDNDHGHSVVGLPTMFVDSGSGFVGSSMSDAGGGVYEGAFAAIDCGSPISFYFSIEDEEGTVVTVPEGGVASPFMTIALDDLTIVIHDDLETDMGWFSFASGATSGDWLRTIPADHNLGDPPADADGSSRCYVTSNNNGVDVDNGSVVLMTPISDVSGIDSPVMKLSAWMFGSAGDSMTIEMSSNAGASWTLVDTITSTAGWEQFAYPIADFVSQTLVFRGRIIVTDGGADSTVEGGIDAYSIVSEICNSVGCPADLNGDGTLNFFDVSAFLTAFGNQDPIADFTGDGMFDFFDISMFLSVFSAGCP